LVIDRNRICSCNITKLQRLFGWAITHKNDSAGDSWRKNKIKGKILLKETKWFLEAGGSYLLEVAGGLSVLTFKKMEIFWTSIFGVIHHWSFSLWS